MIEYELRKLDVDVAQLKEKLEKLDAEFLGLKKFRRHVFDVFPKKDNSWVRLRSDGKKTTLTVKEIVSDTVDGTHEWEVTVNDFDETLKILEKMGLQSRGYQENNRHEYSIDGVDICIDEWPEIPAYVEFEGSDERSVLNTAKKLDFDESDLTGLNTKDIYLNYGIDLDNRPVLQFSN